MNVRQSYVVPRLTRHGTVNDITGWRLERAQALSHEAAALVDGSAPVNYSIDGVVVNLHEEELSSSHNAA